MSNGFERSVVEPEGVAPPAGHFSHGIIASGRHLYVAGQVALDENGELVGGDDAGAQARQVLTNLQRVIESAGANMSDVARTTVPDPARGPGPGGRGEGRVLPVTASGQHSPGGVIAGTTRVPGRDRRHRPRSLNRHTHHSELAI